MMIGTMKVKEMDGFYEKVFDKKPDMVEGEWYGWMVGSSFFSIGHHSKMVGTSKDPGRLIFNFETTDVKGEFARIKEIDGAVVVKDPYEMGGMWIATFADPDGKYFQLMSPWKE